MKLTSHAQKLFFLFILIVSAVAAYKIFYPFQFTVILAFFSVLLCHPAYVFFNAKLRHSKLAVTIVTVLFLSIIVVPILLVGKFLIDQVTIFTSTADFSAKISPIKQFSFTSFTLPTSFFKTLPFHLNPSTVERINEFIADQLKNVGLWFSGFFVGLVGWSFQMFTRLIIFLILFVSLLPHLDSFKKFIRESIPLRPALFDKYVGNINYVLKDVILNTVLVAVSQAIITIIVFTVLGIPSPLFFGLLMVVAGFIPFLGNLIVSILVGGLYIINGNPFIGILILLNHFVILNNVYFVIRPLLQLHKINLHVGLLLLGMFGGIYVFGAVGLIYGPIIMSVLITSLEVVKENYGTS